MCDSRVSSLSQSKWWHSGSVPSLQDSSAQGFRFLQKSPTLFAKQNKIKGGFGFSQQKSSD
jgi:hypothetical protein